MSSLMPIRGQITAIDGKGITIDRNWYPADPAVRLMCPPPKTEVRAYLHNGQISGIQVIEPRKKQRTAKEIRLLSAAWFCVGFMAAAVIFRLLGML